MTKRKNEYGIKCLIMNPVMSIVYPATLAKLQLKAAVEFYPGDFLPEFVELQNTIRQIIDNQKMEVEAATDKLVEILNEFEPKGVKIRVDVINNNSFFPVGAIAAAGEEKEDAPVKKSKPEKKSAKDEDDEPPKEPPKKEDQQL